MNMILSHCTYLAVLVILLFASSTFSSDETESFIDDRVNSIDDLRHSKIKCTLASRDHDASEFTSNEFQLFDQCQPFTRLVNLWTEVTGIVNNHIGDGTPFSLNLLHVRTTLNEKINHLFSSIYKIRSEKVAVQTKSISRSRVITEIGFVGPYPKTNSKHFDHLYSQATDLASVWTWPILKVPTIQDSFFSIYPQYQYLMQYTNSTTSELSRNMYQKVVTIIRLSLEYYTLEVAAKILDTQLNVRNVVVLNWDTIWDENIRTLNTPTDKSSPCDLVSFYRECTLFDNKFDQGKTFIDYIDQNVLKTWYNKIVYFEFATDITAETDCKNEAQANTEPESYVDNRPSASNWETCQLDEIRQCLCQDSDLQMVFLTDDREFKGEFVAFSDNDDTGTSNIDSVIKNSRKEYKTEIDPLQLNDLIEDITQLVIRSASVPTRTKKSRKQSSPKLFKTDETQLGSPSNLQLDYSGFMNARSLSLGSPVDNSPLSATKPRTFINFKKKQKTGFDQLQQEEQQDEDTESSSFLSDHISSTSSQISPKQISPKPKPKSAFRLGSLSSQASLGVHSRRKSTSKTTDQTLHDVDVPVPETSKRMTTKGHVSRMMDLLKKSRETRAQNAPQHVTNQQMHDANSKEARKKSTTQSHVNTQPSSVQVRAQSSLKTRKQYHIGKLPELQLRRNTNPNVQF